MPVPHVLKIFSHFFNLLASERKKSFFFFTMNENFFFTFLSHGMLLNMAFHGKSSRLHNECMWWVIFFFFKILVHFFTSSIFFKCLKSSLMLLKFHLQLTNWKFFFHQVHFINYFLFFLNPAFNDPPISFCYPFFIIWIARTFSSFSLFFHYYVIHNRKI